MSFFTVNRSPEEVKDFTPSGYITESGVYDVTIIHAITKLNKHNATSIDLLVDYEGQRQTIYDAFRLDNNDGKPNIIGQKAFNELLIVAGIDGSINDPEATVVELGKDNEEKEVFVITELNGAEVTVRLQMEYSYYEGEIRQRTLLRKVYRTGDNATAAEIVNDAPKEDKSVEQDNFLGRQFGKELAFADKNIYKDGLTEEDVAAWIASGRGKKNKADKPTAKKPVSFGKKFGK